MTLFDIHTEKKNLKLFAPCTPNFCGCMKIDRESLYLLVSFFLEGGGGWGADKPHLFVHIHYIFHFATKLYNSFFKEKNL